MAETKSIHFSPMLEQPSDETVNITSDIGLFPGGINFEDAHVASRPVEERKKNIVFQVTMTVNIERLLGGK